MTKRHLNPVLRLGVAVTALAMVAAGCGSDDGGSSSASDKNITIGAVQGWTDQTGTAYLYKNLLEASGYTVDIKELSDNAPIYAGLAKGDLDVMGSAWIERTQKSYWDQYKDDLEDLDTYYEGASLFLAVPTYSDVKSIADLPSHADEFNDEVIGIEPGAGLTKLTQDNAFPDYGLDDSFKLVLSSTTAMLTELKKATDSQEPIVVTLWKPFWANQSFPVRPLEDPKGAYGEPEGLHTISRSGFSDDYPEVAEMMSHFKLTDEQYGTLEDTIVNKFGQGKEEQAVQAWLDENPDFAPPLEKYLKN
jgi:glycine betaine/proline transport system substrate-binding protein